MKNIKVNVAKGYEVKLGNNILDNAGEMIKNITDAQKIAIITDDNVGSIYLDRVQKSLKNANFEVRSFSFVPGEKSKNSKTYISILEFLGESKLTRDDLIVALGGGVVGDMAGFAAATYLRGIDFVQIPTTLLAAVDSSVGGKTGIDLECGKNLAGAFCQPQLVICDIECLATLKKETMIDGFAEVIKYGAIFDLDFFALLENFGVSKKGDFDLNLMSDEDKNILMDIISKCIEFKAAIVERDALDKGERLSLNFGHTVGHAIEQMTNFEISHGCAISMGMVIAAQISNKLAYLDFDNTGTKALKSILKTYGLPICLPDNYCQNMSVSELSNMLSEIILLDKKMTTKGLRYVALNSIGEYKIHVFDTKGFTKMLYDILSEEMQ